MAADKDNGRKEPQPALPSPDSAFEYGWCTTDWKEGDKINRKYRNFDYMNDEPYATRVHAMLDQLGLPWPRAEQVFRGTHHDLLFLNSHGVVVRIGPTEVDELIHPGILQPLGWLEDKQSRIDQADFNNKVIYNLPLTVAIFPGIEHASHFEGLPEEERPPMAGNLRKLLQESKQGMFDACSDTNNGVVRTIGDDGTEVGIKVMLDSDNAFNPTPRDTATKLSAAMAEQLAGAPPSANKSDAMFNTLREVFSAVKDMQLWERAFEAHQPLRQMFWDAFRDVEPVTGLPDAEKRAAFWEKCAAVTNKPEAVTLPVWRSEKAADGTLTFTREEIPVPHMVLYRPWTGAEADLALQPLGQSPELAAAVARAHSALTLNAKTKMNAGNPVLSNV